MALGASPRSVATRVLRESGAVTLAGVLCGLPAAIVATRVVEGMFWGVSAADPVLFLGPALALVSIGLISGRLPARRAAAIEPAEALRRG